MKKISESAEYEGGELEGKPITLTKRILDYIVVSPENRKEEEQLAARINQMQLYNQSFDIDTLRIRNQVQRSEIA